ncbi:MAG TPA: isoleucine--tRNA ligase [Bryobacteraceae bacterium]|jgi:isoleucyl-tRNA synthetase|nr:isoleucine--tRNA ligase [Bryobacteraceae bacterium]
MHKLESVPPAFEAPVVEEEILSFWRESQAFEKLRKLREGAPLFRFIDGPITANNPMGVHHAWGRTLKDVFLRYKAMTGHSAKYQNGFDCQGLWVEVEVERAMGFNGKPDIERFGLDNFSRQCRERVDTYAKVISEQSARLGMWMDWDHSYFTYTDSNILGIWKFLQECHRRGWLYQRGLPMPWCWRCGTSLSEHEMAGSHKDLEHLSVYVMATLKATPSRRLLLWTTTPWTLAANVAAAVNPELTYVEVSSHHWSYTLIVGKEALGKLREFHPKVEREIKGTELLDLEYEPFFPELPEQQRVEPHRVVPWTDVDAVEGSGIVHIAPGCGREDHELGELLGLPAISPVDGNGRYLPDFGWLALKHVSDVAQDISYALKESGKLLKAEMHKHSYPVCWRCKNELIFRLVNEWFISCDEIRPQMLEAARTVVWMPEHIGKAMEDWLTNMGDWCISRKRYWGLPLPFYICPQCDDLTVVGSREELRSLAVEPAAVDRLPELHRPWVDDVRIRCPKCSSEAPRVIEVGDCWLDAGIVPYSTLGYLENRAEWERAYPAEWVSEMREQVRLWFYSMLFMSVTLNGRSPYEKVLSYESVVSEEGARFSKTGFMIQFDDAVNKVGADPMRYLFCSRPVSVNMRFSYNLADMAARKIADLWNIYVFLVNYAIIDQPDLSHPVPYDSLQVTDQWLLARTAVMLDAVKQSYESYDTPTAVRDIEAYLDDVSNWYVRVSRRRFWRSGHEDDKRAAYSSLLAALRSTALALAPIIPFITERIWQNAVRGLEPAAAESVHHAEWPVIPKEWRNEALLRRTETVRCVIRPALKLRSQASIRVRQPLQALHVVCPPDKRQAVEEQSAMIQSELNVKEVRFAADSTAFFRRALKADWRAAGAHLRKDVSRFRAVFESLDEETRLALAEHIQDNGQVRVPGFEQPVPADLFRLEQAPDPRYGVAEECGVVVALDLEIPPALKREGLVRDLVRNLQVLRKDAGLSVSQRIELGLTTESDEVREAIRDHREYIMDELLAIRLEDAPLDPFQAETTVTVEGQGVHATMRW